VRIYGTEIAAKDKEERDIQEEFRGRK